MAGLNEKALEVLRRSGVMTMTRSGALPSLVELVAGGAVKGSWWGHPKGKEIFRVASVLEELHDEVLVTKLVEGKTTFVHASLWPALYRVVTAPGSPMPVLTHQEHSPTGKHVTVKTKWEDWASAAVKQGAAKLSLEAAQARLKAACGGALMLSPEKKNGRRKKA